MLSIYKLLALFFLAAFVLYVLSELKNVKNDDKGFPYVSRKFLLTKEEQKFFIVLSEVAKENNLVVFSKVRLWDLIEVQKGTKERVKFENKIRAKHIDFVLTDPESSEVLLLVELDDNSHHRKDRAKSDNFKNETLKASGIKLIRIKVKNHYKKEELQEKILQLLKR